MPTVTQKGQVTIPKDIRDKLGIQPGSIVEFKLVEGRCIVEKEIEKNKIDKWVGYLGSKKKTDDLLNDLRGEIE